jgi:hypothetical protein
MNLIEFFGHKNTLVEHKHDIPDIPPSLSSPLITEDLPASWPCRYMRMDNWTVPNNTVCPVP